MRSRGSEQARAIEPLPPALSALLAERGVAARPGWGANNVVLALEGRMFCLLVSGSLVVKLAKTRVDALIAAGVGERFDPKRNGRGMREWLVYGGPTADWEALAREALAYARP